MRFGTLAVLCVGLAASAAAEEKVDLSIVHRIKSEAFENSKVMEHLMYLTDVYGPRLTGSPAHKTAAEWVVKRLKEYGVSSPKLENWGPFGRGWSYSRFSANLIEPGYAPLIGFPLAWAPGTNGVVAGEPILAVLRTDADLEKHKGKLKDKIILMDQPRAVNLSVAPLAKRFGEDDLTGLFQSDPARRDITADPRPQPVSREEARRFRVKLMQFLKDEGVVLAISTGYRGDGGTVFASSGGSREVKDPIPSPMIVLIPEHYNRIARLIEHKIPVKVEVEVRAQFHDDAAESFNVVGEIPGGRKKEQLIMVGGHLDSWHGGTGATDNAAGCAVAIEAIRILKSLNVPMDRTLRLALWSGEEQGLLGSRAYVKEHFGDKENMTLRPDHAKLSGYFNLDNGTGKIRGVYLQDNDMMRPVFEAWLAPFKDLGVNTIAIRNTTGTDHLSFNEVGLPGFQFIQDPVEYNTRTHHSNMDVYDYVQKGDMMQASAVMASVLYHAAMREEMLPRKPLPKPQPKKSGSEGKKNAPSGE